MLPIFAPFWFPATAAALCGHNTHAPCNELILGSQTKEKCHNLYCLFISVRSMNSTPLEKPNLNDLAAHNVLPVL